MNIMSAYIHTTQAYVNATSINKLGYIALLLRNIFEDPRYEFRYPRTNTGQIRFRTANAPGNDTSEEVAAVLSPDLQRSTGITLA